MGISIRNLNCTINETPILHDISLDFTSGMVGIIGPNGAGKTTLLRTISGYLKPESGSVEIDGIDVRKIDVKSLAKKMALVPQNYALEYDFTVLETVLMGRNPHKKTFESESAEDIRLAREAIAKTGIAHLENRSVIGLSGGEWQRMIIARALVQQSNILLLDEPVSNLDIKHQVGILALVRDLIAGSGLLCVCVLHDLNLASHYCDQIVLMKKGRVIEYGRTEDILKKDILEAVYDTKICMIRAEDGSTYILPEMI
ncbi:ABC transporter ATP-binding protein [Christensenella tenuis]|jgi:iron complex transport system ATP-binding protein|uniref:ABC transporter ATP-binding protein n=1 Tax=Christensenella tenuis TaxID=2763033 RepID=A0ABR7EID5_9FIRM|nr:ABC transporter ATP-binding protein [Christensenella tenuis]MBC5649499.1 ABC transporter ATP-binding protein [Christensenella tenuis]